MIIVLTGAGISQESGIQTFRDSNGLWENHSIEEVASPEGFARNPDLVHQFYNLRRAQLRSPSIQPHAAHRSLARLEQKCVSEFLLITQNVDDLHERAGSQNVLHMHGELFKIRCELCGHRCVWKNDLHHTTSCPKCKKTGGLRPDIVWFGEMPFHLPEIDRALEHCHALIAIGTSGQVYPAAGFVDTVHPECLRIEVNTQSTPISQAFQHHYVGLASEQVPLVVQKLLQNGF